MIGSRLASATAGCLVALCAALATDARAATVQALPVPTGGPHAVAALRSGTEVAVGARNCAYVGRLNVLTGVFAPAVAPLGPLGCTSDDGVFSMLEAPDGKLYFTVYDPPPADGKGAVGRVNPDGSGLETAVVNDGHPLDLAVGSDGNVWFTVNGPPGKVGRIKPASPLTPELGSVPMSVQGPRGIVAAPDGNLYVLGGESGKIWRVVPAAAPSITEVATGQGNPSFGELGPDGRIWFTRFEGDSVAAFDPATNAVSPPVAVAGGPWDIAFGGDGKAYVTRLHAASVVQFTPGSPILTPLTMPVGTVGPGFASRGPGGEVYVADVAANTVLEIVTDQPPVVTTGAPGGVAQTTATVGVTVDTRRLATQVRVEFGPTAGYGSQSAVLEVTGARGATALAVPLAGLTPGTTYHARATATNAGGTRTGADITFTTAAVPGATPAPLATGRVTAAFRVRRKRTSILSLVARDLGKGVVLEIRCSGGGCPFTKKRYKPQTRVATIALTRLFKRRTLRAGRTIEVRITRSDRRGRVVRYKTRATAKPKRTTLCLPVGSTRPGRC